MSTMTWNTPTHFWFHSHHQGNWQSYFGMVIFCFANVSSSSQTFLPLLAWQNLTIFIWSPRLTKTMISEDAKSLTGASTLTVVNMLLLALHGLNTGTKLVIVSHSNFELVISNFELAVMQISSTAIQSHCWSMLILLYFPKKMIKIFSSVQSKEELCSAKGTCIAMQAPVVCT